MSVFLGGRDRRGGPVLTFPSRSNHDRIRTDDLRRLIAYLAGIPRLHIHYICSPVRVRLRYCVRAAVSLNKRRFLKANTRSKWMKLCRETREGAVMSM